MTADNDVYPHCRTVGSMFTGIGGLDLGLEASGRRIVWQAETNPYASKLLKKHWPDVPNLGDVTTIDWSSVVRPDLVCAGFPCQPVSHAGARRGQDDERWLWPEVARCLRLVRPGWVLLENVPGILTLGFGQVAADLADLGYDFRWDCIPAAAVGAPHLRYRIFVVAHADRQSEHDGAVDAEVGSAPQPVANPDDAGDRTPGPGTDRKRQAGHTERPITLAQPGGRREDVADAIGELRPSSRPRSVPGTEGTREGEAPQRQRVRAHTGAGGRTLADPDGRRLEHRHQTVRRLPVIDEEGVGDTDKPSQDAHTTPGGSWGAVGESGWWESEPDVGRVAHGVPDRVDRLRCLGNAVVPQVAELVARMWLP